MKRMLSTLLAMLLVFSLNCPSVLAISNDMEETEVKRVTEDYLSSQMNSIYLRTSTINSISQKTLLDVVRNTVPADKTADATPDDGVANAVPADETEASVPAGEAEDTVPSNKAEDTASDGGSEDTVPVDETEATAPAPIDSYLSLSRQAAMESFYETNEPALMSSMDRSKITINDMLNDLQCMEDMVTFKSYIFEDQNITFSSFDVDYIFGDITINDNYAMVEVCQELNYQYSFCNEPSYELVEFNVMLIKLNGEWIIADAASEDNAFMSYFTSGYDLDEEIAGYDEAIRLEKETAATDLEDNNISEIAATTTSGNIAYNKQNAVNYALTYTTQDDDGTGTPTFKNSRFHWFGVDCMNFASQCVWAGFGGSNSYADIPAHQGMDAVGSATWWCDSAQGSGSWQSCSSFRSYVTNSNAAADKGLVCTTQEVACGSNTFPYSASQLVGSVLHVEGYVGGVATKYAHAVFVNAATGNTRGSVYVCAYNNCRKNVLLSTLYSANANKPTRAIYVIVPQTFRGGESGARLWGDLFNVIVTHTATKTLVGHSNTSLASFEMVLLKPNGGQAGKWTANNTSTVTATYNNWNTVGEWSIRLTGTTSAGAKITWYQTIRVV